MSEIKRENSKVAVFIDGENITAKVADRLIEEVANYGDVIVKRVFADWSSPNVQAWKEVVAKHSLIAEQQFSAVKGKNSSDMALIINVMNVLYEKNIDIFCLASSDSDFTRLVQELREREKIVVGFGLKQTAQAFVNAFSEFIYLDSETNEKEVQTVAKQKLDILGILGKERTNALKEIIDKLIEDDGFALYARIGIEMKNKYSDFVPKNYNCKSMKELLGKVINEIGSYEIKMGADGTTMFLINKKIDDLEDKKTAKKYVDQEIVSKPLQEKKPTIKRQSNQDKKTVNNVGKVHIGNKKTNATKSYLSKLNKENKKSVRSSSGKKANHDR